MTTILQIHKDDDEKVLVSQMKNGNYKAFGLLYEKYFNCLFLFTLKMIKVRVEAEEIVQSLFVKIWLKRDKIDVNQNFKSYIYRIAVNDVYNYTKKKIVERSYQEHVTYHTSHSEQRILEDLYGVELQSSIENLINKMPAQQKQIFLLNKDAGLTNDEISVRLNISKRTVENHLYRAMTYLKQKIKDKVPAIFLLVLLV
jgi:RNA polymerase sigma-70 factor (family 1)